MFTGGVQNRLRFCLDQLSCVEMGPFSVICNWVNRELGWVGDDSHDMFGQKFSGKKWSVRQYVVVKVRGEIFAHIHAVAVKRLNSMRNWLFGLLG
jgi:hypothetical protein